MTKREQVARIIAERAIGVTWEMLHADRRAARLAQRSGTSITDYGVHQDEVLDAADAVIAYLAAWGDSLP
jgi:hypothetical protein